MRNFTTKIFLRTNQKNADNTHTIYLRITIKRKVNIFSLGIKVLLSDFDFNSVRVKRTNQKHFSYNKLISKIEQRANEITLNKFLEDKHLTLKKFEKHVFEKDKVLGDSYVDFVKAELNESTNLSKETIKSYKSQLNKIIVYRPELTFEEIDFRFIKNYERYLLKSINRNSANKSLRVFKSHLNTAIKQGIYMKDNPFNDFKISNVNGKRDYLTLEEVNRLENLFYSNTLSKNKSIVLRYFLFCCYTGLRYTDIKNLKLEDLKENGTNKIIEIQMHKTKMVVRIPIIEKAEKLIEYPEYSNTNRNVFKVFVSQVTNRHLKDIAKDCNINKKLSFHVSRHTLATNSLELGIPIEIISQILGHTDIKTTQIYTKVSDKLKTTQMEKFNF